jgi:hypothetical protein
MLTPKSGAAELVLLDANAEVLKPATPAPVKSGGQTIRGSSMLLALNDDKANQVIFAAMTSTLYLTLRPLKASQTPPYATSLASVLADNGASVFGPTPNSTSTPNGAKP